MASEMAAFLARRVSRVVRASAVDLVCVLPSRVEYMRRLFQYGSRR